MLCIHFFSSLLRLSLDTRLVINIFVVAAVTACYYMLIYLPKRLAHSKEINALTNEYERQVLQSKAEMQEQTFENISRDIHDNIGQKLSFAKFQVTRYGLQPGIELKDIADTLDKAIADLRTLGTSLSSQLVSGYGLVHAIDQEIALMEKTGYYKMSFAVAGSPVSLPVDKELIIYRIYQEGTQNIIKHSGADVITVNLGYDTENLIMRISDNGRGLAQQEKAGLGLSNIRSRTQLLNGTFTLSSSAAGTDLLIKIPIQS